MHFETKRKKNNSWIASSCTLEKLTNGSFREYMKDDKKESKEIHERFVVIDPGVRTPFVMYSPTERITEIGKNDVQRLVRLCLHADKLSSTRDKLKSSISKRKKKKAKRVDKAISRIFRT